MSFEDDWNAVLTDHSIFALPEPDASASRDVSLELSTATLPQFMAEEEDPLEDSGTPSGRRQVIVLRDSDLVVALGKEIRMCSLEDARLGRGTKKSYKVRVLFQAAVSRLPTHASDKVLHTPNIQFEAHQLALNPSGKLLAVAGAFQVAVIVLPRQGFMRLVPNTIDCK